MNADERTRATPGTRTHIAHGAILAALRGRLITYRLDTPTLERVAQLALLAMHGQKETPLVDTLTALRRDALAIVRVREQLDVANIGQDAHATAPDAPQLAGGTRVPLGPPPTRPLSPQARRAEEQVLHLSADAL